MVFIEGYCGLGMYLGGEEISEIADLVKTGLGEIPGVHAPRTRINGTINPSPNSSQNIALWVVPSNA